MCIFVFGITLAKQQRMSRVNFVNVHTNRYHHTGGTRTGSARRTSNSVGAGTPAHCAGVLHGRSQGSARRTRKPLV